MYFDINSIESPEKINKAYIISDVEYEEDSIEYAEVSMNNTFTFDEKELQVSKITEYYKVTSRPVAELSETIKLLTETNIPNRGILLKNLSKLENPRLKLVYQSNIIYPDKCHIFFSKELLLTTYSKQIISPWFFTGLSQTITIFVQNLGANQVNIYLQNSPNAHQTVDDAQIITVNPRETVDIVPYKFSKYLRLVADSNQTKVAIKMWFQTQLMNH